ncbi:hypothetical protein HZA42_01850 [Candidatus Peregrinibacteria bacterium]|nr:hypothetical protein [Candidatus Peregrinibacteria bacterium]
MLFHHIKEKIQYPKLILLLISILVAYALFRTHTFSQIAEILNSHGYTAIFIAGFLFAYGFTAPLAVGFFISLAPQVNVFIAAPLAGVGALLADLLIFKFIRSSFQDEFDKLKLTLIFQRIRNLLDNHLHETVKKYLLWTIAGFLIASPLPDEFGVALISGFTKLDKKVFSMISYLLNTSGIFVILALA